MFPLSDSYPHTILWSISLRSCSLPYFHHWPQVNRNNSPNFPRKSRTSSLSDKSNNVITDFYLEKKIRVDEENIEPTFWSKVRSRNLRTFLHNHKTNANTKLFKHHKLFEISSYNPCEPGWINPFWNSFSALHWFNCQRIKNRLKFALIHRSNSSWVAA